MKLAKTLVAGRLQVSVLEIKISTHVCRDLMFATFHLERLRTFLTHDVGKIRNLGRRTRQGEKHEAYYQFTWPNGM